MASSASNDKLSKIPAEYKPISMWGYFGYSLLFMIPLVGFILTIVFAFTAPNINLRNYARSQFCVAIIALVLIILFVVISFIAASSLATPTLRVRY